MKFKLKSLRKLITYISLLSTQLSLVHAGYPQQSNYVEIFYDNIQNLDKPIINQDPPEEIQENQILPPVEYIDDSTPTDIILPQDKNDLAVPPIFNEQTIEEPPISINLPFEEEIITKQNLVTEHQLKQKSRLKNRKQKSVPTVINKKNSRKVQPISPLPQKAPMISVEIPIDNPQIDKDEPLIEDLNPQVEILDNMVAPTSQVPEVNDIPVQSIDDIEILPDEAPSTIDLNNEESFEEKLKKVQEEKSPKNEVSQKKNWKQYIPFFKKKDIVQPEIQHNPVQKQPVQLPSLPENNIEQFENNNDSLEQNSSLEVLDHNLSLRFAPENQELQSEDKNKIDQLIFQAKHNNQALKIIGYNAINNDESRKLTLQRVVNIRQYLIENGMASDFLSVQILPENQEAGKFAGMVNFLLIGENG